MRRPREENLRLYSRQCHQVHAAAGTMWPESGYLELLHAKSASCEGSRSGMANGCSAEVAAMSAVRLLFHAEVAGLPPAINSGQIGGDFCI
jgi:hypothetical protein